MPTEFYSGSDWETHVGPYTTRNVQSDDLWPHAGQGPAGKDALADGLHPILAIGNDAVAEGRLATSPTGVMVTYNSTLSRAVMAVQNGMVVRQYVDNILSYSAGDANAFETSLQIGMPVYVDDSNDLAAGVTLSLSPSNDAGLANPLAGWIWYDQTEDESALIGGANSDVWPKTVANEKTSVLCNILMRGCG